MRTRPDAGAEDDPMSFPNGLDRFNYVASMDKHVVASKILNMMCVASNLGKPT